MISSMRHRSVLALLLIQTALAGLAQTESAERLKARVHQLHAKGNRVTVTTTDQTVIRAFTGVADESFTILPENGAAGNNRSILPVNRRQEEWLIQEGYSDSGGHCGGRRAHPVRGSLPARVSLPQGSFLEAAHVQVSALVHFSRVSGDSGDPPASAASFRINLRPKKMWKAGVCSSTVIVGRIGH